MREGWRYVTASRARPLRLLGHSDINTTYRRYVRPSADDLVAAVESVLG